MSQTVDQVFVKEYVAEFHEAYQRKGSKLRGTIRTESFVAGEDTNFPKVGKGLATQKGRNSAIPPMNLDHSSVACPMADWYAADFADKLDLLKLKMNEREAIINAGVYTLGRKTDELIVTELDTATNTNVDFVPTGMTDDQAALLIGGMLQAGAALSKRDVPDDGDRYGPLTPETWALAMLDPRFASSDYVGDHPLAQWTEVRRWMGTIWFSFTGLTDSGSLVMNNAVYHRSALGHGINGDIMTDITWQGTHAAWFINSMMSMGACVIDDDGIQLMPVDVTAID